MNFADMNNILTNLVQTDNSGFGARAEGNAKGAGADFASKLDKEIRKMDTPDGRSAGQVKNHKPEGRAAETVKDFTPEQKGVPKKKSGVKILSDLENVLLKLSGGDLDAVAINQEGLDTLKKLLVKAGFDAEQVSDVIDRLKEKAGTKELELGEVMDSLSLLDTDIEEISPPDDVFLETSALPFVATLLDAFGLSGEVTGNIMAKADKGREGVSLNVVVEELATIASGYDQTGSSAKIKADAGTVSNVLDQLNIPVPENTGSEKIALKDLLTAFDTYIKSKQVQTGKTVENTAVQRADTPITESAGSLVEKLFESLTMRPEKSSSPEFSFQQVKDQFENELIIPAKNQKVKNSLFSQKQSGSTSSPDTFLKELETVFSKSGATGAGNSRGEAEGQAGFRKETKTEPIKSFDILQGAAGQGKNDIGENLVNGLRAKAPERALPSYVTQQVNKSIVRAINQGETSLTLQLKPAALGRLSMTIDNTGNSIKVSILTENHSAKEMLALNVNELKTALSSAGISLDSFDVNMSSDFKQSMADTGNPAGRFNRKNGQNGQADADGEGLGAEDNLTGISDGMPMDGSYHFVA